jgi:membrane protease YdiL (CAAX protease family)
MPCILLARLKYGYGRFRVPSAVLLALRGARTALTLLRLRSGGLWLPIGYHWAWNVVQTAVLGAPDAAPSVRPLHVHGPRRWMGWPGHPEPGLLSTLIHLAVVLLAWVGMRRSGVEGRRGVRK